MTKQELIGATLYGQYRLKYLPNKKGDDNDLVLLVLLEEMHVFIYPLTFLS